MNVSDANHSCYTRPLMVGRLQAPPSFDGTYGGTELVPVKQLKCITASSQGITILLAQGYSSHPLFESLA